MTAWVPDGAWLAPGYAEWPAPAALREAVACLWTRVVPDDEAADTVVLPDGCCDLIWEWGAGVYVAGPDTAAVSTPIRPGAWCVGVRFRPAHGGPVLGVPLSEIRDQRVELADLLSAAAGAGRTLALRRASAELAATAWAGDGPTAESLTGNRPAGDGLTGNRLTGDRGSPAAAAALVADLAGSLVAARVRDPETARAALLLRDPAARAEEIAAEAGLSERQFRRRFHAAAGYGPKTMQRVLRFQHFVRRVDAARGVVDLAVEAAEAGYADQAHLTRECKALSGMTPAVLARVRGKGPAPGQAASGGSPIIAEPMTRKPSLE